ncbi:DNA (cytosine-5-)-methyltransferase [Capnocytophaga canimorsus]|uniref:DNA (cytosine-5-)-methyltransferase n=1 Tax=Capnocytophaga canimorsus TaxID=28188 RepID=UPI00385BBB13
MMKHFDAFAGIGGFTRAFKNIFGIDYQNVGFSEINKYAAACYQYHFPNHKNYGDITTIRPQDIGAIDIFTAGFPCQAFSIAGKRRGFEDARGTLFFEIARICKYLQPKYILLENVKGLLNHDGGRTISIIYQSLIDLGYTIEFQVVNTKWFLPQNRERLYIIGHLATSERSFKPIFPIGENDFLFGNPKKPNERQSQTQYSSTLKASGTTKADDTFVEVPKVANCLTGGGHSGGLHSDMTTIKVGTFRTHNDGKGFREVKSEVCPTIPARARQDGSGQPVILSYTRDGKGKVINRNERSFCNTLTQATGGGGNTDVFVKQLPRGKNKGADLEVCPTISSNAFQENNFVSGLRRLTEIECERLQGFPDNWTKYGNYDGKIKEIAKTQRYKMLGNAVSVPVVEEIARRLKNNFKG